MLEWEIIPHSWVQAIYITNNIAFPIKTRIPFHKVTVISILVRITMAWTGLVQYNITSFIYNISYILTYWDIITYFHNTECCSVQTVSVQEGGQTNSNFFFVLLWQKFQQLIQKWSMKRCSLKGSHHLLKVQNHRYCSIHIEWAWQNIQIQSSTTHSSSLRLS